MKTWLKFGLIFSGIFALINIIFLPIGAIGIIVPIDFAGLFLAALFGYDIMNSSTIFTGYFVLMILGSAIFWFIIGAIVGWIINRIKNKK
ncbi:MAG: hypothetical protein WC781_03130 [Candidatus Pacearchaeota archaeon]|jgi:hypothetical protein